MQHQITIEIDDAALGQVSDRQLAMFWHVAQANPASHGDPVAGALTERIGREIIRRWLAAAPAELWHHQGRHHPHQQLVRFAFYTPGPGEPGTPEWEQGHWTAHPQQDVSPPRQGDPDGSRR